MIGMICNSDVAKISSFVADEPSLLDAADEPSPLVDPPPLFKKRKTKLILTKKALAKWARVGFFELTSSTPLDTGLEIEANSASPAPLIISPPKQGEIVSANYVPPHVSISQQGIVSLDLVTTTGGDVGDSLHTILEI
ncbi:hypothetical protein ACFE04_002779 [Oxalis oulophora]